MKLMTTNQIPKGGGWVTFGEQVREGVGFGHGFSVRVKMSKGIQMEESGNMDGAERPAPTTGYRPKII